MTPPRTRPFWLRVLLPIAVLALCAPMSALAKGGKGKKGKKKKGADDGPGALVVLAADIGGGLTGLGMFGFDDPTTEGTASLFENRALGPHTQGELTAGIPLWGNRKDMFYACVGGRLVGGNVRGKMDVEAAGSTTSTGFVAETGTETVDYQIRLQGLSLGMGGHTKWTFSQVTFGRAIGTVSASGSKGTEESDVQASILGLKMGYRATLANIVAIRMGGELVAYPGGLRPADPDAVLPIADAFSFPVYSLGLIAGVQVIL